jgi:hypothetical protein
MARYVKTNKATGQIISLLKPKRTPTGRKPTNPLQLGYDPRGNHGGVRFVKWRQRLSQLSAEMLGQVASDEECAFFGIATGSTHGEILVRCLYVFATHGDTGATQHTTQVSLTVP